MTFRTAMLGARSTSDPPASMACLCRPEPVISGTGRDQMRPSTVREGNHYRGAIRDGKRIVWTCEHLHRNRDMSPGIRQSARDCAAQEVKRRA